MADLSGRQSGASAAPTTTIATRARRGGWTLVELLVVVGVIGLLIAIIIPSMWWAREASRRAVCMSNHKQLVMAALQYSMDHQGQLIPAFTAPGGWVNTGNDAYSITSGLLFPYLNGGMPSNLTQAQVDTGPGPKVLKTYLCPSDYFVATNIRTYSINAFLNDSTVGTLVPNGVYLTRLSQVKCPATLIYLIDEYDNRGYNQNGFCEDPVVLTQFRDTPGIFHFNGCNLSFVDGHVEYWKWKDARTMQLLPGVSSGQPSPNNPDLAKLQAYLWTGLTN